MSSATAFPLVSIVIPCYNYGRYVGQAIESALAQTYAPKEVVVMDDGSTDDTLDVAGRYPVTLLCQANRGSAAAFNAGIRASRGELFSLLDADDVIHPDFLQRTVPVLREHPETAFVYTHAVTFGREHAVLLRREYDVRRLGQGGFMGGACLVRRAAFEATAGFDSALRHGEDWDLWLSLAERGYAGRLVPRILFAYRKHAGGLAERNPLGLRWRSLIYLRRKHPTWIRRRWLARLAAYDLLFLLVTQARRLSPRGYEWLRGRARALRPRLGGVERRRPEELTFGEGDDLGYEDMMRYLASVGCEFQGS